VMSGKVQIWLRLDQAECAAEALRYIHSRFTENGRTTSNPEYRLATKLAADRARDVSELIENAIARMQG
jgi:hypothetical protein